MAGAKEPHELGIAEAAALIRGRRLSPVELVKALLARIERFDRGVSAFITLTAESALKEARAAEQDILTGRYRGPLHGIPYALKDLYDTAGVLTTANSKLYARRIPAADATAVAKLRDAGALLLGKLKTHEFAQGGPATDLPWPPARNPWDLERFTGGSSSGSAAAVAAGFVPASLGTDTGGSIRGPASLCGIVGLRPTYGLVSRHGVFPNSYTFDACGPMARSVEDCAIVLQAIAGFDENDPASARADVPDYSGALRTDLRGVRIAVLRHFWEEDLPAQDDVRSAMEASLKVLQDLGARLDVVRLRPLREYYDVRNVIALSELMAIQHRDLIERPGDFCLDFLGRGLAACLFQSLDYVEAQRERRVMEAEMRALYGTYDAFVSPASPAPAPRLDAYRTSGYWERPNITTPFSISGGPAVSVCNGYNGSGLPLGLQIGGRPFDDRTVLAIGHAYETATDWKGRRPELSDRAPSPLEIPAEEAPSPDPALEALVQTMAARAGFRLGARHFEALFRAAPHALAMSGRLRRRRNPGDEPSNTYKHPGT
jgi:aspartyl-tRNA(Asn)/glutamyl-tRNA(Gln) amidotransferase subunit A